jgi:hypothetical protein
MLLVMLVNIEQGWKGLTETNALAYFGPDEKKSFIKYPPGSDRMKETP